MCKRTDAPFVGRSRQRRCGRRRRCSPLNRAVGGPAQYLLVLVGVFLFESGLVCVRVGVRLVAVPVFVVMLGVVVVVVGMLV